MRKNYSKWRQWCDKGGAFNLKFKINCIYTRAILDFISKEQSEISGTNMDQGVSNESSPNLLQGFIVGYVKNWNVAVVLPVPAIWL